MQVVSVGKEKCTVDLESGQAKLLAALRFSEKCAEEFRYLKVKSEKVSVNEKADGITVGGEFVCIENIGKEVPLEIEETE